MPSLRRRNPSGLAIDDHATAPLPVAAGPGDHRSPSVLKEWDLMITLSVAVSPRPWSTYPIFRTRRAFRSCGGLSGHRESPYAPPGVGSSRRFLHHGLSPHVYQSTALP